MAINCSATLLKISWIGVEFPTNSELILSPFDRILQSDILTKFGIHSSKKTKLRSKSNNNN